MTVMDVILGFCNNMESSRIGKVIIQGIGAWHHGISLHVYIFALVRIE